MSTGNPPAGYYADPSVPGYIRYWDGTGWVAGTSRPAPDEVADQVLASSQAGAVAQSGGAPGPQSQQPDAPRDVPPPRPEAAPAPAGAQSVLPQPVPPQSVPRPEPVASSAPETVATMVVPSAFGVRPATNHHGYSYLDPFAGLPGAPAAAQPDEQPEVEAKVVELATPGSRILARIIDLGIAALLSGPVTVSLLLVAHNHDHQYVQHLDAEATTTYTTLGMDGLGIVLWAGALVALLVAAILLEGNRLGRGGQSFGKRLVGIRVVRLQDGSPVTRRSVAVRRSLLFWVLAILPLIDVLALGGVLWGRPYRQGVHERLTSTVTVKA